MHRHDCDGGPHSFPNQRFKLVHAPCKFAAFQRDSHGGVTDRNGFPLFHSPNPNWLPPAFNRKSPRVFAGDCFLVSRTPSRLRAPMCHRLYSVPPQPAIQ